MEHFSQEEDSVACWYVWEQDKFLRATWTPLLCMAELMSLLHYVCNDYAWLYTQYIHVCRHIELLGIGTEPFKHLVYIYMYIQLSKATCTYYCENKVGYFLVKIDDEKITQLAIWLITTRRQGVIMWNDIIIFTECLFFLSNGDLRQLHHQVFINFEKLVQRWQNSLQELGDNCI